MIPSGILTSVTNSAPIVVGDAAYSLIRLKTAYVGSAIRVRRSSDNAESDIGFSGNSLDLVALAAFIGASNGYVTTWYDQSGNAKNATQTTNANQPQITLTGDILWDGTNDSLNLGANVIVSNITFNSSGTWSFWMKPSRTNQVLLGITDNNATGLGYLILHTGNNIAFRNIQNTSNSNQYTTTSPIVLNTWQNIVVTFTLSTRIVQIYKNGISQTVDNTALGGGTKFTDIAQSLFLGYNIYNGGMTYNYYAGYYDECQIYKSVLTSTDILNNYNATKSKYGL